MSQYFSPQRRQRQKKEKNTVAQTQNHCRRPRAPAAGYPLRPEATGSYQGRRLKHHWLPPPRLERAGVMPVLVRASSAPRDYSRVQRRWKVRRIWGKTRPKKHQRKDEIKSFKRAKKVSEETNTKRDGRRANKTWIDQKVVEGSLGAACEVDCVNTGYVYDVKVIVIPLFTAWKPSPTLSRYSFSPYVLS